MRARADIGRAWHDAGDQRADRAARREGRPDHHRRLSRRARDRQRAALRYVRPPDRAAGAAGGTPPAADGARTASAPTAKRCCRSTRRECAMPLAHCAMPACNRSRSRFSTPIAIRRTSSRRKRIVEDECPGIAVCTSAEHRPGDTRVRAVFHLRGECLHRADRATGICWNWSGRWRAVVRRCCPMAASPRRVPPPTQPIALVESGPAAGAMGAAFLARQAGWDDVIAFDMGGTTAKVSLIHGGQPHRTHELEAARLRAVQEGQRPAAAAAGNRADRDRRRRRQHRRGR